MGSLAALGQTRNAWRHCGFVLTPLATPCRSTLGARLFSASAALPAPCGAAWASRRAGTEAENGSRIGMLICRTRH